MHRTLPLVCTLLLAAQASAFTVVVNVQHATCGNTTGNIWVNPLGGTAPYTYLWSPAPPSGNGTPYISGVSPGTWTVTVTDAMGTDVTEVIELIATDDLFPPITPPPAWSCDGGCNAGFYYYVPLSGANMPYTVTFDPPGPTGGASPNGLYFNNLCPGESYTVTVTDDNGCSGTVGPITVLGDMAPELLSSDATGSCPGGATGSLTFAFNAVDSVIVEGPSGVLWVPTSNPMTVTNLEPGDHTITAYRMSLPPSPPGTTSGTTCSTTVVLNVPVTTDPCGSISGTLYADLDTDCDQGPADPGMPWRVLTIQPGDHFTLTDASGNYATQLFYDDYALDTAPDGYAVVCPTLPAPFTLDAGSPAVTIDVAMEPLFGPDASAFLALGVHRPGFAVDYHVSATNQGPYTFPGASLNLYFDPLLTLTDNAGGLLLVPGHLQWVLGDLGPYSNVSFTVTFTVPANAGLIGTAVSGTAALGLAEPDSDPDNDSYTVTTTIIGAYDPNDKLAFTSSRSSEDHYYLDLDSWVDYTIRFQNTGTAEAINVYLLDTIAPELDLLSLQLLGASHDFTASLLPGRVLRFDFPDIMLPDSTSDFAGSQGFASFRLRPVDGLLPGDVLRNAADIFFDFNEPIRTNDADLLVEFSTGIAGRMEDRVTLFPNPVRDALQVLVPEGRWNVLITAMDGRIAQERGLSGDRLSLDTSALAAGSYLLRLTGQDGTLLHARFVKH